MNICKIISSTLSQQCCHACTKMEPSVKLSEQKIYNFVIVTLPCSLEFDNEVNYKIGDNGFDVTGWYRIIIIKNDSIEGFTNTN